jgi:adenylylsulfate kinase-like enzyme
MKNLKKKQEGTLFWITGLSGSGKTSIAEKIKKVGVCCLKKVILSKPFVVKLKNKNL